jgi:single-strand DNA-binding protein
LSKGTNLVILLGHLGKDPEIRATAGGTIVANLSLATAESRKDNTGQWQEHTEWHSLVSFGRTAEVFRDYTAKGSQVMVRGRLQTRSWDDKDSGQKRYKTEIVVDDLTLLSKNPNAQQTQAAASNQDYANTEITDDDIPF